MASESQMYILFMASTFKIYLDGGIMIFLQTFLSLPDCKRGCTFGSRLSRNYWRFYQKLNSTFLNNMESELVSLGVWESKEIIYHYNFIPSSTLFRSMKFRIFPESEIVHRKTTVVLIHFVRKRRSFFKEKMFQKRPSFSHKMYQNDVFFLVNYFKFGENAELHAAK